MNYIFEIKDKTGRKIRLTEKQWNHITSPSSLHPYMTNYLEEVKQTLEKPNMIVPNKYDDTKVNYYRFLKDRRQYLLVAVGLSNLRELWRFSPLLSNVGSF